MKARYLFTPVRTALADSYPALKPLRSAVRAEDWPAVTAYFDGLTPGADAGPAVRTAGVFSATAFLQQAHAADPTSALARTLLASHLIELGWKARTAKRAQYVSKGRFDAFHGYLGEAEDLLAGISHAPVLESAVWALRMMTVRGLGLGQNEAWRRYLLARDAVAHPLGAQIQMLQQLCPKWGGSFEQLHQFTAECAWSAPEGALQGALVAEGHIEQWLELDSGSAYLRQPHVRKAIDESAARSVLHPSCQQGPGWVWAHNCFAMAYSMMGRRRDARPHFAALGDRASVWPWEYLGGPASSYRLNYAVTWLAGGWRG
jgi:hypothetical protein